VLVGNQPDISISEINAVAGYAEEVRGNRTVLLATSTPGCGGPEGACGYYLLS
jgi:hypothetical protein